MARSSARSNQNMRLPQHGSSTAWSSHPSALPLNRHNAGLAAPTRQEHLVTGADRQVIGLNNGNDFSALRSRTYTSTPRRLKTVLNGRAGDAPNHPTRHLGGAAVIAFNLASGPITTAAPMALPALTFLSD